MKEPHTFSSPVGPAISRYLALKKALGRKYINETNILRHLDQFLVRDKQHVSPLTAASFSAWCLTFAHLSPTVKRSWMRVARNLCLYICRSDPTCFVPDPSLFPAKHTAVRPHIFTELEIVRVLARVAKLARRGNSPLCPEVFRLAIVLLYTAGLRRGELVRLTLSDYDAAEKTLWIRPSKFCKSRLIALSNDAARELEAYLCARRRLQKAPQGPNARILVTGHHGRRTYSGESLANRLRVIFREAGVRTTLGRVARIHDLRHTFAVHTLSRWYRTGADVQAKLPALCAAMGHVSIASTAYYLSFVAPVAQAASDRFERHFDHLLIGLARDGGGR